MEVEVVGLLHVHPDTRGPPATLQRLKGGSGDRMEATDRSMLRALLPDAFRVGGNASVIIAVLSVVSMTPPTHHGHGARVRGSAPARNIKGLFGRAPSLKNGFGSSFSIFWFF